MIILRTFFSCLEFVAKILLSYLLCICGLLLHSIDGCCATMVEHRTVLLLFNIFLYKIVNAA